MKPLYLFFLFCSFALLLANATTHSETEKRDIICATLILEAGGEGKEGMEAVWEVIWNRANGKTENLYSVVTRPKQFSCWNSNSFSKLVEKSKTHPLWETAQKISAERPKTVLTFGANHHCRKEITPYWAKNVKPTATIRNHKFFKL